MTYIYQKGKQLQSECTILSEELNKVDKEGWKGGGRGRGGRGRGGRGRQGRGRQGRGRQGRVVRRSVVDANSFTKMKLQLEEEAKLRTQLEAQLSALMNANEKEKADLRRRSFDCKVTSEEGTLQSHHPQS